MFSNHTMCSMLHFQDSSNEMQSYTYEIFGVFFRIEGWFFLHILDKRAIGFGPNVIYRNKELSFRYQKSFFHSKNFFVFVFPITFIFGYFIISKAFHWVFQQDSMVEVTVSLSDECSKESMQFSFLRKKKNWHFPEIFPKREKKKSIPRIIIPQVM